MNGQESLREIANLRLRFEINNRLRLESLAALSKVFRDHGEPLKDDLLASLVFALPDELPGEAHFSQAPLDQAEAAPQPAGQPIFEEPAPGHPPTQPSPGQPPAGQPPAGLPPPGTPPAGLPPPGKPSRRAPSKKRRGGARPKKRSAKKPAKKKRR